jgi:outer membrane receptor for ferrienterochelin and colicins
MQPIKIYQVAVHIEIGVVTRIKIITTLLLFSSNIIVAQQLIKGKVNIQSSADADKLLPAIGAKVKCLNDHVITTCNPEGYFEINITDYCKQLVIAYPGYLTDTIQIKTSGEFINITLSTKKAKLKGVNVYASKPATQISYLSTNQLFTITQKELCKAACCNLSESFETTPSVDVSYSDAITGQKQIQLLGLSTPNTLITQENIPMIRGISAIVGLNFTPGTWLESMQLSKGTGSVANGFEGAAGQINVELEKPNADKILLTNVYQNSSGRSEGNVNLSHQWNDKLSSGLLLHYKNQWYTTDMQNDGFMDNPLGDQKIGLYRMSYVGAKGTNIQGGVKIISSHAKGGEITPSLLHPFVFNSKNDRQEAWLKIGKIINKNKPWKSIGWQQALINDDQSLNTSIKDYDGKQHTYYTNLIYQDRIGYTNHSYRVGASYIYDNITETTPDNNLPNINKKEHTIGAFAEHTYAYLDNFTLVSGVRLDHSNLLGWFATPRLHLRYSKNGRHVFRASTGRAQRTASVVSENQQMYFTNRSITFLDNLANWQSNFQKEIAWNSGLSYTMPFQLNYQKGTLVLDYYYTTFLNSIIADYESPNEIKIFNLKNNHNTHSAQAQIDYTVLRKKLDVRLAYRYVDTKIRYSDGTLLNKPLQSFHRAFINAGYYNKKLVDADLTLVWNGPKRLPNTKSTSDQPHAYAMQYSPSFVTINGQISKNLGKKHYLYLGAENATNYMQHQPIITSHHSNPANVYLDATQAWGPAMGINMYLGYTFKVQR